ncbi:MAG: LD-carboxypeptidase [Bacteroidota bacterium]|nr:LD-carboxypeptidase [Bacteroidota bacterium]
MNIIPPYLQQGDTVAILCTARKISKNEIEKACKLLHAWGLQVKLGNTIGKEYHQFGGTDEQRANDFQQMLNDKDVKAIWCARGGYGTVRIIEKIDFSKILQNPKWIIGFSDVTVLHSHLHNLGVASIHGIMPINVGTATQMAEQSLYKTLFGQKNIYEIPSSKNNQLGKATGVLVGGNLSILYSLLGSASAIDTDGKILFFEDLDEYLYHIDRMLMNLQRNDYFKNIKAIIVGGMTLMHDNAIAFGISIPEMLLDKICEMNIPVCFDFPAGHIDDNRTLLLGATVELEILEERVTLKYV